MKLHHVLWVNLCLLAILVLTPIQTVSANGSQPTITIIIDDIGYRKQADLRALALPGPIAYAILPHAPHTETMALLANQRGKEILLHQPMQALNFEKNEYLGPGALTLNMTRDEFMQTLQVNMRSVPNLIGINNHMGSLLTRHPGLMRWLMESIKSHGQIYIDSLTSKESVAGSIAKETGIPYLIRDVFLDNEQNKAYIRGQFMELINVAKRKGSAIAIGHPYISTIDVLNEVIPDIEKQGVKLISIKSLMHLRSIVRISHHPSAVTDDPLAVTKRTRSSRFDRVSTMPSSSSTACVPTQRRLDTLATKGGKKCEPEKKIWAKY